MLGGLNAIATLKLFTQNYFKYGRISFTVRKRNKFWAYPPGARLFKPLHVSAQTERRPAWGRPFKNLKFEIRSEFALKSPFSLWFYTLETLSRTWSSRICKKTVSKFRKSNFLHFTNKRHLNLCRKNQITTLLNFFSTNMTSIHKRKKWSIIIILKRSKINFELHWWTNERKNQNRARNSWIVMISHCFKSSKRSI